MSVAVLFERVFSKTPAVVAVVHGQEKTNTQLQLQILQLAAYLKAQPEKNWLMWADGAYAFLLQFCALCLANKTLVLPGNSQPGALARIAPAFSAVLSEHKLTWAADDKKFITLAAILAQDEAADATVIDPVLWIENSPDVDIVLYTSGSTGEPKPVEKTLSLLTKEVLAQNSAWSDVVGQDTVVSTVSHQHIYGMLHYVLWPVYRGAPFVEPLSHLPEEVFDIAAAHQPCMLVSSPTHIKRLPAFFNANEKSVKFNEVFSSAGLLQRSDALSMAGIARAAPIEIFGSTETGGVAWRRQSKDTEARYWQALPGVVAHKNNATGCLVIASDYMVESNYEMSDAIGEIGEQGFVLNGRSDKVVKVEGKRLSLSAMEAQLLAHEWVLAAKLIVIKNKREEVCAAVVLTEYGQSELAKNTKLAMNKVFKHSLSQHFEMPLLPRKWRYVNALPKDAQGKVTFDALKILFDGTGQ